MIKVFITVMISLLFASEFSVAQKILSFDMVEMQIGNETVAHSNYNDSHLSSSVLTRGPGINYLDSAWLANNFQLDPGLFNSYNWTSSTSIDLNDYIEFTISPNTGWQFSINSIVLQYEREQNGPQNFVLRTSEDGFSSNIDGVFNIPRIRRASELPVYSTINLNLINLDHAVTVRIYGYNSPNALHTWGIGAGTHDSSDHNPNSDDHIKVNGFVNLVGSPSVFIDISGLSFFSYFLNSGPSPANSFLVAGYNLTGDLSIDCSSTDYEVSIDNSIFSTSLTVPNVSGNVSLTPVYVRLKSGKNVGNYVQDITISSSGAASRTIKCDGFVSAYNLVINEILSQGDAGDANGDGSNNNVNNDEFVEIVNIGSTDVNLNGFRLFRRNVSHHTFSSVNLPLGQAIVVFGGGSISNFTSSLAQLSSYGGLYLTDATDTVTINDNNNHRVAAVSFGQEAAELNSISRNPDFIGSFVRQSSIIENPVDFSPGMSNTSPTPLPVELSAFSAVVLPGKVKLNWKTETEVNNYGFEIERKVGSGQYSVGNYERIGFVNGNGNSNSPKNYFYEDNNVNAGKYLYRLKQIDNDGKYNYSQAIEVDLNIPSKFELSQNYPNPFNPATTIKFSLATAGEVKLTVFNLLGEELATLVNEIKEAGIHTVNFDASNYNSGLYIYKIETGGNVQSRKMILLK